MVLPLTSLMTLVAGGSKLEPLVPDWVAIISILLPSVVRNPFLGSVTPFNSSLPATEVTRLAGIVVPLVVVPMICSPGAVLVASPLEMLTTAADEDEPGAADEDDRWR